MKAAYGRLATVACAIAFAPLSTALAQGIFHFEDDFNRDAWFNAQTNTALPPWSAPGAGGFNVPSGNATTPPPSFVGEVVVTGTHMQIKANGQVYLELDDADLAPGSVGVMSWAERGTTPGMQAGGARWEDLLLFDENDQPVFQETWAPAAGPWKVVNPKMADGTATNINTATGNFRWDFVNGAIIEDTDVFVRPTADPNPVSPPPPPTGYDFLGPTVVYTGAGSNDWGDYRVRTRMRANDDDGFGLIVRCFEDDDTIQFYRVHFCGTQNDNTNLRPVRGVGIQKAVIDKATGNTTWTRLLTSTAFVYTNNRPFDVSVTVQNVSPTETSIQVDVTDDAVSNPTPISPFIASDTTDPIQSGTVGLMAWAIFVGNWSSYGGVSTPFVETLGGSPATLLGDIFTGPHNGWAIHTYDAAPTGGNTTRQKWGSLLLTGELLENSDGRQTDGTTTGGVPAGNYTPFIMYKSGFATGSDYTLRSTMKNDDNDGQGLVFGYTANGDTSYKYFRAAFRPEAGSNFGFPTGISVQKVVKEEGGSPVITNLGISVGRGSRANQAGVWLKKFATGTIEQTDNGNLRDDSGRDGIEWVGTRLVRGDLAWTDYAFETEIEVQDNWGIGLLFRYQDEDSYYRLTFNGVDPNAQPPTGIPAGVSLVKVENGVFTELFRDSDETKAGDNNVDPTAGFIYSDGISGIGYRIFRPRVIVTGGTIQIQVDAIPDDGSGIEFPNYYTATVVDPAPLANGQVGLHTWNQNANEFRDIKLTLDGQAQPEFVDGDGAPDEKGWVDATLETPFTNGVVSGTAGVGAGAPISGIGYRIDLDALGVRDNRWIVGTPIIPGNNARGCANWDGPRAVVGRTNWKDYTFKVDMRTFDNDGMGAVFRYIDESNFYRISFLNEANNGNGGPPRGLAVQKRLNGAYTEVFYDASLAFVYDIGQWWTTEITCTGSHFDIKITEIDGPRAGMVHNFSFDDPTDPILTGKVGVTCWGSDGAANEVNAILGGLDWTKNFVEGAVWDNVVVDGTLGRIAPDLTGDGRINGDDLTLWQNCVTGPAILAVDPTPTCVTADVDLDGDVDSTDYGYFQRCYSGNEGFDAGCVVD